MDQHQHQHDSIDLLLKRTLNSTHSPDEVLNQKIKKRMKEKMNMERTRRKSVYKVSLIASLLIIVMSVGAFAAWNYLSPDELAEHFEYSVLSEAFKGEDAILINKSETSGEYKFTLMGIVSGKGLGLTSFSDDYDIDTEESYIAVAIEKLNGKMPDIQSEEYGNERFFISPLIKGLIPWHVNVASLDIGGYNESVIDGVQYRLISCSSIEMFADRGIYLAVSSGGDFYDTNAFTFDFESGEIIPNPDFDGVNVIFDLPIDKAKADPKKVEEFLNERYQGDYVKEMKRIEIHVKAQQYFDEEYQGDYQKDEMKASLQKLLDGLFSGEYTEEMLEEMVENAIFSKKLEEDRSNPEIVQQQEQFNKLIDELIIFEASYTEEEIKIKVEQFMDSIHDGSYTEEMLDEMMARVKESLQR
ncbi:hypothetical protein SAMN05446037_10286 [Anaerovirgula multivorans]|uniref:DUF4179 domain-containing protein n=1 Tax=Anaerovirgula multivorans TaxID=312168 RepID=A0A239IHD4_9FIRM|nr:hypothetical protein [Anaerovirgula multivorans]SNS92668.1 hypothetical protein SAMN05446037_10286 [Anaerovirgula multivorans]